MWFAFFFFSSRSRHTRYWRDWSSDVCSSDLREAGDRAYGLSAWGAAVRFYEEALELWPAEDPDRGMLLFRYGQVVSLHDAGGRGAEILEEARDVLFAFGASEQAAMAEVALVDSYWFSGAPDRARKHLRRSEELIEGATPSRPKAFVLSQIAGSRC